MSNATGATFVFGFEKHTNTWGSGLPVAVGAGDGIEVESPDLLSVDAHFIENMGLSGNATQLPGVKGIELHAGDIPMPLTYRGADLPIAMVMGTLVAAVRQGSTNAYLHGLRLAADHEGLYGTLVGYGADHPVLREYAHTKFTGFTIDWQPDQIAKLTMKTAAHGMHLCPADDDDRIVTAIEPANGVQAIAAQPQYPAPLTVTITDANASITEYVLAIVGLDQDGNAISETYTLSVDGLTWTSDYRWSSVTSITASGLAGTATGDTLEVGTANVNNPTTYASISLPSTADYEYVSFDQLKFYINDQGDADFVDGTDDVPLDGLTLNVELGLKTDKVTTRFGRRIDEPTLDGFIKVTLSLKFPQWYETEADLLAKRIRQAPQKAKIVCTGPTADGAYPLLWQFFLNNLQFPGGSPSGGGPGQMRCDFEVQAHRASSSPTGLPAWANTQPISAAVTNLRSSAIWA